MNKMTKRQSVTIQYVLLFGILLLLMNAVLGGVMMRQSGAAMKTLIRKNMQDIARTAAALLDGDALGALTDADVDTPAYRAILQELTAFQNNAEIEYIYAVRQVGDDEYIFTVDADPAEYGERIVVTDALRQAAKGFPAVDDAPTQDEWGCFYSAFSPVYDADGRIAGIIGVDFDSLWYEEQLHRHMLSFAVITGLSVLAGGFLVFLLTRNVRKRLAALDGELAVLSSGVDELTREIRSSTGGGPGEQAHAEESLLPDGGDEIETLGRRIRYMQANLKSFLAYAHELAYTDGLTGVRNSTAYIEVQTRIDAKIRDRSAAFYLVLFDVNDLKRINDRCGHAAGDHLIRGAADAIRSAFGPACTFRIGGDEFLAVAEHGAGESEIPGKLARTDAAIAAFNDEKRDISVLLSISRGAAVYHPEQDASFRDVFIRADDAMYQDKREYYRRNGMTFRT